MTTLKVKNNVLLYYILPEGPVWVTNKLEINTLITCYRGRHICASELTLFDFSVV